MVGGAGSARHAEELAGELFGVTVMDYRLPDGDGATTAKRIGAGKDGPAVVMVLASGHDSVIAAALEAECSGYVIKARAVREVVAVRTAARGDMTFPVKAPARLVPGADCQSEGNCSSECTGDCKGS